MCSEFLQSISLRILTAWEETVICESNCSSSSSSSSSYHVVSMECNCNQNGLDWWHASKDQQVGRCIWSSHLLQGDQEGVSTHEWIGDQVTGWSDNAELSCQRHYLGLTLIINTKYKSFYINNSYKPVSLWCNNDWYICSIAKMYSAICTNTLHHWTMNKLSVNNFFYHWITYSVTRSDLPAQLDRCEWNPDPEPGVAQDDVDTSCVSVHQLFSLSLHYIQKHTSTVLHIYHYCILTVWQHTKIIHF